MTRATAVLAGVVLACSLVACGGGTPSSPTPAPPGPDVSSVRAWTGTLEVLSNYQGSGSSNIGGMDIIEDFRQETTARLNVTLARDAAATGMWVGTAQGPVSILNRNNMTMIAPGAVVVCNALLTWIGNDPLFSTTLRVEADSNGSTVRLYLGRRSIPAPDSGNVACPAGGLAFPTTDPNSPFGPIELLSGLSLSPAIDASQSLFAMTIVQGHSGIGGFAVGPIPYTITLKLTAVP